MRTHEISETQNLSHRIMQWANGSDWYHTDIQTNQLRLERAFGQIIEAIAKDLDYHNQLRLRRQVFDCYDMLMIKCRQVDIVCRIGCRDESELLELEFLKSKAIAAAAELADVLALLERKNGTTDTCGTDPLGINDTGNQCEKKNKDNDDWITFSEAAELIGVTKGTISKWAAEGKFTDNGRKLKRRKLLKTSVLLVKQKLEDRDILVDAKELREDARQLKIARS